ncbi:DUF4440 domain-containing protein [Compostimonas suwonensis]|uniref:DUF4440 domain-containing protein n=1 Tax=Compostimonas suwonensis TaxID=1048394 RepID=A0A2M9BW51_9MICO|nr:DUF4440 domain-containing protein [Compostimonas suwonensis]PJJ62187.1 hypothetical protein CLV54_1984 [Compostimonas suwonensis]
MSDEHDRAAIDDITREFFAAFRSADVRVDRAADHAEAVEPGADRFERLARLFTPEARIVKMDAGTPLVYTVDEFIAPRRELLTNGRLRGFSEWETSATTTIAGTIAQRWSSYSKEGLLDGEPNSGSGVKASSFIKHAGVWKILSVAWTDEP